MTHREAIFDEVDDSTYDVAIVGAGINGSVIAAALATHGVKVLLVDRGDIAGYTSQASSNMVWGGFKYLESYDVKLVWDLCRSRNRMIRSYPTNVVPVTFTANLDHDSPHPPWFAYLGALTYWAFGRFKTKRPRLLSRKALEGIAPVIDTSNSRGGIAYDDAYLPENDARFVFQFANTAAKAGARVLTYTNVGDADLIGGKRSQRYWSLALTDQLTGVEATARASILINAAGPFADSFNEVIDAPTKHHLALSKGIHLIVDRIADPDRVLVFYDDAGRLFYVLPMGQRSSIGTTDTRLDAPTNVAGEEDQAFLLEQINARLDLDEPLTDADVISTRAGVRPLVIEPGSGDTSREDWTKLSRKHTVETDRRRRLITVFGGKLTDCVNVGEELLADVRRMGVRVPRRSEGWYGEPGSIARASMIDECVSVGFSTETAERLWRRYHHDVGRLIELVLNDPSLVKPVFDGDDFRRCEAVHIGRHEMVETVEDILRRRTMLELTLGRSRLIEDPALDDLATLAFGIGGSRAAAAYRSGALI